MATILVTGGTGFLGRHLVPALCRAGYHQRILTRQPQAHPWLTHYPHIDILRGDVRRPETLAAAVAGCDAIIHAAGLFSMWHEAGDFAAHNAEGTQHMLRLALAAGVRRFIYVSTIAVIGQPIPGRIVDETHPTHPADPYQQSKRAAEDLTRQAFEREGLEAVIVRPGAFYGPLGDYAFNRLFFTDPLRGIMMQMDGGKYIIFPAYVGDVARGIVAALQRGRAGEVYHLCGDCISHRAAFDMICQEAGLWWPRLNIPGVIGIQFARLLTAVAHITQREPFYPLGLKSYVFNDWRVSNEKARRELGFQPIHFRDGVRRTIAWYRASKPLLLPELMCVEAATS